MTWLLMLWTWDSFTAISKETGYRLTAFETCELIRKSLNLNERQRARVFLIYHYGAF